jgi:hypothetical protein
VTLPGVAKKKVALYTGRTRVCRILIKRDPTRHFLSLGTLGCLRPFFIGILKVGKLYALLIVRPYRCSRRNSSRSERREGAKRRQ